MVESPKEELVLEVAGHPDKRKEFLAFLQQNNVSFSFPGPFIIEETLTEVKELLIRLSPVFVMIVYDWYKEKRKKKEDIKIKIKTKEGTSVELTAKNISKFVFKEESEH